MDASMEILFVCYGCTCRSPMAAVIAQHLLGPGHRISAAGWRPEPEVDKRASTVLREMNMKPKHLRRRAVKDLNLEKFDLVIALSESVHQHLKAARTRRLRLWKIDDPYFGKIETYRTTAAALQKRIVRLKKLS
jgi:protein-tyrosine-phosphatase